MSPSLVLCERKNSIAANFSMRVKAKISRMRNRSQQKKGCRLLIFRIVFYPGFQAHLTLPEPGAGSTSSSDANRGDSPDKLNPSGGSHQVWRTPYSHCSRGSRTAYTDKPPHVGLR